MKQCRRIEVTEFRLDMKAAEPGESRPVDLVKVQLRLLTEGDRIDFKVTGSTSCLSRRRRWSWRTGGGTSR